MATGLLLHSVCAVLGRRGASANLVDTLFWLSLMVIFLPAAIRVAHHRTLTQERLVLTVGVGVSLMLSRVVLNPVRFAYHDELAHVNTLRLIESTHHLFTTNPLLPVSSWYPGLEITTLGAQAVTGLDTHAAGVLVLVLARLVMMLSLIGVVWRVSGSARVGCLATLIYVCNPQFLFFNSQFSYQSLALPLAFMSLALFVMRPTESGSRALVLPILTISGTIVTHHLTGMLLVLAYAAWLSVEVLRHGWRRDARDLSLVTGVGALVLVAWTLRSGNPALGYLLEIGEGSASDMSKLAHGQQTHKFFTDFDGDRTPLWQQAASLASIVLILGGLVPALLRARVWWRRGTSLAVLLALTAIGYPGIPGGHLTFATSEVSDRSAGFLFLGVGFVIGWWLVDRDAGVLVPLPAHRSGGPSRPRFLGLNRGVVRTAAAVVVAGTVFVGGIVSGAGPRWNRTPGPYLVSADARSADAANLAAAVWLHDNEPRQSRVLADRVGRLLAGGVGGAYPVTHIADRVNASELLLAPTFTTLDESLIRSARLQLVVVDERISASMPRVGVYYENGEYGQVDRRQPVPAEALTKLSHVRGVQRVYDNGSVVIYDVRDLL